MIFEILYNFWLIFTESAPYLILGLFAAGLIHALVPKTLIVKYLGQGRAAIVRAAIIGAPIPLCSCSVIPTAIEIHRAGASKPGTVSFLVSTPETGVDSVGISFALLGPFLAIYRPLAAVISAIVTGLCVYFLDKPNASSTGENTEAESCCTSSCSDNLDQLETKHTMHWLSNLRNGSVYAFTNLLADFMNWLLLGIFLAALVQTFLPHHLVLEYGQNIFTMLAVVIISIPMYICATASTPIAAAMIFAGLSPGTAIVFMLAGPATNIATLMMVKNELGHKTMVIYVVSVIIMSLLCGLMLDFLATWVNLGSTNMVDSMQQHQSSAIYQACAIFLTAMIILQYCLKIKRYKLHH